MKNNIGAILRVKGISIRRLSRLWNKPYAYTYNLVTRDDVSSITIGTLQELADLLRVDVTDLYK